MSIKLNYLLIPFLVVSLAGNVLFYFKIGELEENIQKISQYQHKNQSLPVVKNENQDQNDNITYKTFSSPKADFTFEYPSNWVYDEEEISTVYNGKEIKTMAWKFYLNLFGDNYNLKPPCLEVQSPAYYETLGFYSAVYKNYETLNFYSTGYKEGTKFPYQLNTFPTNDPETYVTCEQGGDGWGIVFIYWQKGEAFANAYCISDIHFKVNLMIFYPAEVGGELQKIEKVVQHIAKSIKIK